MVGFRFTCLDLLRLTAPVPVRACTLPHYLYLERGLRTRALPYSATPPCLPYLPLVGLRDRTTVACRALPLHPALTYMHLSPFDILPYLHCI